MCATRSKKTYHVTTDRFSTGRFVGTSDQRETLWHFKSKSAYLAAVENWTKMDPAKFSMRVRVEEASV